MSFFFRFTFFWMFLFIQILLNGHINILALCVILK